MFFFSYSVNEIVLSKRRDRGRDMSVMDFGGIIIWAIGGGPQDVNKCGPWAHRMWVAKTIMEAAEQHVWLSWSCRL